MRGAVVAAGAVLCLTGAALTVALALRGDDARGASRTVARAALLDRPLPSSLQLSQEQGGTRLRYWRSLVDFEQAIAPGPVTRADRLRRLARAASVLEAEAGGPPSADRSRALTLLGLIAFGRASLEPAGSEARRVGTHDAVSEFRAAVAADPGNDDAKTDLELLLRTARASGGGAAAGRGKATKHRQIPGPVGAPSGAGSAASSAPVGY